MSSAIHDVGSGGRGRLLTVTYFANEKTSVATGEESLTWGGLKNKLRQRHVRKSKSGPAFSPVKFRPNAKRSNSGVARVEFLAVDLDVDDEAGEKIVRDLLAAVGEYEWFCGTTHSHDPQHGKHRLRIIFPTTRPIQPEEYAQVRRGLNVLLRGLVDDATNDLARLYYLPSCSPETVGEAWWEENDGEWLDPDYLKTLGVVGNARRAATSQTVRLIGDPSDLSARPKNPPQETAEEVARVRSMLGVINPDVERNVWRDVVWGLLSTQWTCAESLAREWSMRGEKFKERDFDGVVRSFRPGADNIGFGTLIHHTKAAGWQDAPAKSSAEKTQLHRELTWECAAACPPRAVNWMWPGKIARGKVSLIAGSPGLGKSQLTISAISIVTTGGLWPVDRTRCSIGSVIVLSAEDDLGDTLVPRFMAAGANRKRIHVLRSVIERGAHKTFDITRDLASLEAKIAAVGDVALVVVDPLSAYLGNTDSHDNSQVRAVLTLLADLASRYGVAVIGVTHLNKGASTDAHSRIIGSTAFVAAARACFIVVRDPADEQRRLLLAVKNNLGSDRGGLAYRIEQVTLPSAHGDIVTSRVVWENGLVNDIEIQEALAPSEDRTSGKAAERLLNELLAHGPASARDLHEEAAAQGIKPKTLQRAADRLGVIKSKSGMAGGWFWSLAAKGVQHPGGDSAQRKLDETGGGQPKATQSALLQKMSSSYSSRDMSSSKASKPPEGDKATRVAGMSSSMTPSAISNLPEWQAAAAARQAL